MQHIIDAKPLICPVCDISDLEIKHNIGINNCAAHFACLLISQQRCVNVLRLL